MNRKKVTSAVVRKKTLTPVCAWCGKVRVENGTWVEPEADKVRDRLPITHGACPECAKDLSAAALRYREKKPAPRRK